ncbi:MAG TPA: hypothetical protein VGV41_22955 [Pseudolabrys sp.]|uniref:hypothetical protein n=1 Tax=Pseudolabrys sp. TaxID=1960880 RepID=UPI002DDDBC9F|nr:hypothetical protein [Pseudolabrys sp.]HEV2631494.1 hypothetical protein [Pseudolabrys sp.]
MPREVIEIPVHRGGFAEAISDIFSYIAYPDAMENSERLRFSRSMQIALAAYRSELDPDWEGKQTVDAFFEFITEGPAAATFKRGFAKSRNHLLVGRYFLKPQLLGLETPNRGARVGDFAATIQNCALNMARATNKSDGTASTIEARYWKPAKPIVHLAYAMDENLAEFSSRLATLAEDEMPDGFLALLLNNQLASHVIAAAEQARCQFPYIGYPFVEEETLKFVCDAP